MAEDRKLPIMANRGQTPYIPTGYEGLEQGVQRKRRIADALMQQGLAGPGAGARSWAQLLGSLAQTWAGKSIQKDADKEEQEINAKRQAAVQEATTAFEADLASGATPGMIVQKYGGNPWVKERIKPFEDAMAADLKNKQEYGAPTEMLGPDGKSFITAQVNKAGDIRQAPGGFALPQKIEIVNGVAVAPQRMAPGTVAPQPAMDAVIVGPGGKFIPNKLAQEAKVQQAAAGAANTKITVEGNQDANKMGLDILEKSFEKANGAAATLRLVGNVRTALNTGKVSSGPLSDVKTFFERLTGTNAEGLSNRRMVEQSLAQAAISARPQMGSGTSISMGEQKLIDKAALGDISQFTNEELYATAKALERWSLDTLDAHDRQVAKSRGLPYGPAVELFEVERPAGYERKAPVKAKAAPRPAKKGLPPKGATPTKAKPSNPYSNLLPKPAGGL